MRIRRREISLGIALVVLTLAVYAPALSGGFVWDDDDYVTENDTLRSGDGLRRIWFEIGAVPQYYPLVHTTFWIEHRLYGLDPTGYHLVNVLLHAVGALLLWRILAGLGVPGAWAAAAIFAIHPLNVESVAWITERKNVLSGALYLGAALVYLREAPLRRRYPLAFALFALALLSKTTAATLPCALALVLWWRHGLRPARDWTPLAPMLALGAALSGLTLAMESETVGASGPDWDLSPATRLIVAGRALWFYAGKLLWPVELSFVYPRWSPSPGAVVEYVPALLAVAVVAVLFALRTRIGKGPVTAVLFYAGTLFPALGFFDVYPMRYSFVADHFAYLAGIGPVALAVAAVSTGLARAGARPIIAIGLTVAAVLPLAAIARQRTGVFESEEILWQETVRTNPRAFLAHNNLGAMRIERGETEAAERHLLLALEAKRDYPEALDNLGIVRHRQGRVEEAVALYREALAVDPRFANAHSNLGISLAALSRLDEAMLHFDEAVRIRPDLAGAWFNRGVALRALGRSEEAERSFAEARRRAR